MSAPPPREAASVILARRRGDGFEVLLVRRHRKASFMSSAFVFPGGAADPGESDPRATAARELFEEAGVLLCAPELAAGAREEMRARLCEPGASLSELLADAGAALALEKLHYFAHWITPSVEPRRFSARFFVAELPAGQKPAHDRRETVELTWVTPNEAIARAGELRLPPPQVRTLSELGDAAAGGGLDGLVAAVRARAAHPHPILPRFAQLERGFCLLLPWDPEYETLGTGETMPMPGDHPLAGGPSRFILEGTTWKNVHAPSSDRAG